MLHVSSPLSCPFPFCFSPVNSLIIAKYQKENLIKREAYVYRTLQRQGTSTCFGNLMLLAVCPAGGALRQSGRSGAQLCAPSAHQQGPGGAVRLAAPASGRRAAGWRGQRRASPGGCPRLDSGAGHSDGGRCWESECVSCFFGYNLTCTF